MEGSVTYNRHADLIGKEEFILLFTNGESPETWFSENELKEFPFPEHARSLAARYLIKKRICERLGEQVSPKEIEILNDPFGKPGIMFGEDVRTAVERSGVREILCSISHSRNYITGMTIFCL